MVYTDFIRLCNSVGKTPSSVAIEAGLSKTTITRWKKGSKPRDTTLSRVADYFDTNIENSLNEPQSYTVQDCETHKMDAKQKYQRLSENGQTIVDSVIERLLSEGDKQLVGQIIDSLFAAERRS